jgi:ribose 5-phosphate isomerase B
VAVQSRGDLAAIPLTCHFQEAVPIFIASDHAGFAFKARLVEFLKGKGYEVGDLGPSSEARVDYPDFAKAVAGEVLKTPDAHGILICGSGLGMMISANKVPGIRATCAWNEESARLGRAHNDAQILCLGQRLIDFDTACVCAETFLTTAFEGGRHQQRVDKIAAIEAEGPPSC